MNKSIGQNWLNKKTIWIYSSFPHKLGRNKKESIQSFFIGANDFLFEIVNWWKNGSELRGLNGISLIETLFFFTNSWHQYDQIHRTRARSSESNELANGTKLSEDFQLIKTIKNKEARQNESKLKKLWKNLDAAFVMGPGQDLVKKSVRLAMNSGEKRTFFFTAKRPNFLALKAVNFCKIFGF